MLPKTEITILVVHQQIKETPAINYSSAKRIIADRQDYNPPVKDYNGL